MLRSFDEDFARDLESTIRDVMRTQALWDDAHDEEQADDDAFDGELDGAEDFTGH